MEKNLYRGVVVLATALSLIGAILLFAGAARAGLGLLGIALASLPFLMHLQTRQLGSMLKYRFTHLENKLKSASSTSALLSRSEEHTSELQSRFDLVCRLLLEKKKNNNI